MSPYCSLCLAVLALAASAASPDVLVMGTADAASLLPPFALRVARCGAAPAALLSASQPESATFAFLVPRACFGGLLSPRAYAALVGRGGAEAPLTLLLAEAEAPVSEPRSGRVVANALPTITRRGVRASVATPPLGLGEAQTAAAVLGFLGGVLAFVRRGLLARASTLEEPTQPEPLLGPQPEQQPIKQLPQQLQLAPQPAPQPAPEPAPESLMQPAPRFGYDVGGREKQARRLVLARDEADVTAALLEELRRGGGIAVALRRSD